MALSSTVESDLFLAKERCCRCVGPAPSLPVYNLVNNERFCFFYQPTLGLKVSLWLHTSEDRDSLSEEAGVGTDHSLLIISV